MRGKPLPAPGAVMFIGEYPDIPPEVIDSLRAETAAQPVVREIDWRQALEMWGGET